MLGEPSPLNHLPLNLACVLVLCFSICHTCMRGVSLSSVPDGVLPHYWPCGVVPHYQACVLLRCLSVGNAFWFDVSLSTVSFGVMPHYRPCLLVCCHCNGYFTSQLQIEGLLQVWYHLYRGVITSDMSADLVPLSDFLHVQCISVRHTC